MSDFAQRAAALSPTRRRLLEQRLKGRRPPREPGPATTGIPAVPRDGPLPLSDAQRRLWFLHRADPADASYNMPLPLRLVGPLDSPALAQALAEIVRRHEVLRTIFVAVDGEPRQLIMPPSQDDVAVVDLGALPPDARSAEAQRLAAEEAARPFDLASETPFRASLLRLGDDEHVLLCTVHHIAFDGWSIGVLLRELAELYGAFAAGRPSPLPEPPIQVADYAAWEAGWLGGPDVQAQLSACRDHLTDLPTLDLPTDRPRPAARSGRGGRREIAVPAATAAALERLAREESGPPFASLLAAFSALLARHTGQDDMGIGTPVANRGRRETRDLIGFFANTVVIRTDLGGDPTFRELTRRARDAAGVAFANQDVPFDRLVEALQPERLSGQNPLFQVLFALQNSPLPAVELTGLQFGMFETEAAATRFDLECHVLPLPDGLRVVLYYDADLFEAATVERLAARFEALLESAATAPDRRLSELPLVPDGERETLHSCASDPERRPRWWAEAVAIPDGARIEVVDAAGQVVPIGVWGDVALDVPTEPGADAPKTATRTGDRARWRFDGALEVATTTDRYTWGGGHRVDLARAEAAILAGGSVAACTVVGREIVDGQRADGELADGEIALVAYVVPSGPLAANAIRERAADLLPPAATIAVVPVSNLPLRADGAVDRAALARLPVLDEDLERRWQDHLGAAYGSDRVAVLIEEREARTPPLHLADLLAPARPESPGALPSEDTAEQREDAASARPSFADGGPLVIPPDAPKTFTEALLRTAATRPDAGITFVGSDGRARFVSYPVLLERARRILTGLRGAGLAPGSRAILQVEALEDHYAAFWGCVLGGITPVAVAVAPSYAERNGVVNKLFNTWHLLEQPAIIASRGLVEPIRGLNALLPMRDAAILPVEDLADNPPAEQIHEARPDDLLFFQLTSGSTGVPKCIQETHRAVIAHVHGSQQFNAYTPDDVTLNWLPVDHVVPILTYHLKDVYLGCRQVHVRTDLILADPLRWLDLIEEHRVVVTWAPNFGFKLIADRLRASSDRRWDLSSVRYFMNAGEQVTLPVVRDFLAAVAPFGVPQRAMQPSFGMAEACTCMTYLNGFDEATGVRRFLKSSLGGRLVQAHGDDATTVAFVDLGPPMPGVQIRITDRDNVVRPEGTIGRFQIKGDVITPGYLNNPDANAEAFVGDGWFNSGDLGFILDGRLTLTGREKEMIVVRGANFYCYEIEDVANAVEGVEPTFVGACAVADASSGTEGVAVVFVPKDGADQVETVRQVRARVAASLGIGPSHVVPIERSEFPKTTSGKIQRSQLRQWLEDGRFDATLRRLDVALENERTVPDWFFRRVWRRAAPSRDAGAPPGDLLVFADRGGLVESLADSPAPTYGRRVTVTAGDGFARLASDRFTIDPRAEADYARLLDGLSADGYEFGSILHLWTCDGPCEPDDLNAARDLGVNSLLLLVRALAERRGPDHPLRLLMASRGAQAAGGVAARVGLAPLLGVVRTVPRELPWLDCRHLDLGRDRTAGDGAAILAELAALPAESEVAYRSGRRLVPRLEKIDPRRCELRPVPFVAGGRYLLTGGLGGVGAEVGARLLREYGARLLLVGRAPHPNESGDAERVARIQALARLGDVRYRSVDVADADDLRAVVAEVEADWGGRLDGVLHLAGLTVDRQIVDETPATLAATMRPKVEGTLAVDGLARERPGCLLVLFSSANGTFGGFGAGAYSAANAFMDAVALERARLGLPTLCLGWSLWDATGMSRDYALRDLSRARGYRPIAPEQGVNSLLVASRLGEPHLLVGLDETRPAISVHLGGPPHALHELRGYVAPPDGSPSDSAGGLDALPDRFGTPSRCHMVAVTEIPRTATGAIDLAALAALGGRRTAEAIGPRTDLERRLVVIWRELLNVPSVGIHDNFFELGGHSLLAVQLLDRIHRQTGHEPSLDALFGSPTIAGLARALERRAPDAAGASLTAARPTSDAPASPLLVPLRAGSGRPVYFAAPIMGFAFPYAGLAQQLGGNRPFFGLQPPGLVGEEPPCQTIEALAARLLAAIRQRQPTGPYTLGGWSFGGVVAFEMARQIRALGETVDLLMVLDTPAPATGLDLAGARMLFGELSKGLLPYLRDYAQLRRAAPQRTGPAPTVRTMADVLAASGRALREYRPAPLDGRLVLLRAADGPATPRRDPTLGWAPLASGGVVTRRVPGSHMTLLREPHVGALARELSAWLNGSP